jgi:ankyrin repeat protein
MGEGLISACFDGQAREVRRLLSEGADVNDADELGRTPLMAASQNGHVEIVDMLLAAEANANAANDEGNTALDFASIQHRPLHGVIQWAPYHSAASHSLWC